MSGEQKVKIIKNVETGKKYQEDDQSSQAI